MDKISISVRKIVEYAYRSGHLDITYRSTTRALEGIDVHKKLQGLEGQGYEKEYYLSFIVPYKEIQFEITGRADGVFTLDGLHYIDEIKSTTLSPEDIGDGGMVHWGQAYLYAYMFLCLNDFDEMGIRLRYYNVETKETTVLTQTKGKIELEQIAVEILDKYHDWARLLIQSDLLFVDSAKVLDFPYSTYRKGQRKMAVSVYETIKKKKRIFLQAPTGIGKTISTLYPALKLMGQDEVEKIYYLTARSSAKEVAFDTMRIITDKGVRVKSVLITAKEKICFMEECQCHKDYCQYAENYFDKINGALFDAIQNYDLFSRDIIENIARKHQVCPFELTLEISLYSDVTICDYNYFYDPRVSLRRGFGEESVKTVVLVDEAHNLPDRAREMYSADLVRSEFLEVSRPLKDSWKKVYKSIRGINKILLELSKEVDTDGTTVIELPESLPHKLRTMTNVLDEWLGKNKGNKHHKEVLDLYFRAW
ncbi:MAG: ATP-dependent helicase, partial [Firmicutes bacterium HGW-Firmicutes-18]